MASHDVFHRHEYAQDMARQLLQPSSLQLQVRSGVFLTGIRRIGKTTFLRQDLIPTLEAMGALVIYVVVPEKFISEPVRSVLTAC